MHSLTAAPGLCSLRADQAHVFQEQRLPSEEQQLHFCRGYVGAMQQFLKQQAAGAAADGAATGGGQAASSSLPSVILAAGAAAAQRSVDSNSAGGSAEEHAARLLLRKAQAHMPLVHIAWGLWGLIQDKVRACARPAGCSAPEGWLLLVLLVVYSAADALSPCLPYCAAVANARWD